MELEVDICNADLVTVEVLIVDRKPFGSDLRINAVKALSDLEINQLKTRFSTKEHCLSGHLDQ